MILDEDICGAAETNSVSAQPQRLRSLQESHLSLG